MNFKFSIIVKSVFAAFGMSILAFFLSHYICEEVLVHQLNSEIIIKYHSEQEMDLIVEFNKIEGISSEILTKKSISYGENILKLRLPRNLEIEQIYFMTNPRNVVFEISEISFQSSLASLSWKNDALLKIIALHKSQILKSKLVVLTDKETVRINLSDAIPIGFVKNEFSKTIYKTIRGKLFTISLIVMPFIFIISLFLLLKSQVLESITGYVLGFGFTFIILIIVPIFSQKDNYSMENRILAEFPDLNQLIWNIPMKYNEYFNDHFPYRSRLSRLNNLIKIGLLHTSPMPDHVRIGKEGWLFNYREEIKDTYMGIHLYSEKELSHIQFLLEEKEKWLTSQGSDFYLLILPLKPDVYPEFLPSSMISRNSVNKRTQIISYLKKNSRIKLIDGYEALVKKKDSVRLFYKTDTHWNQLGAFFTYVGLMKKIKMDYPELKPLSLSEYLVTQHHDVYSGDLLGIMNTDTFFSRDPYILKLKKDITAKMYPNSPMIQGESNYIFYENRKAPKIRLLIFRDSFSTYLIPHLSESFAFSGYSWSPQVLPQRVFDVAPNIVIHELTQFSLDLLLEDNPEIMRQKSSLE